LSSSLLLPCIPGKKHAGIATGCMPPYSLPAATWEDPADFVGTQEVFYLSPLPSYWSASLWLPAWDLSACTLPCPSACLVTAWACVYLVSVTCIKCLCTVNFGLSPFLLLFGRGRCGLYACLSVVLWNFFVAYCCCEYYSLLCLCGYLACMQYLLERDMCCVRFSCPVPCTLTHGSCRAWASLFSLLRGCHAILHGERCCDMCLARV